MPVGERHLHLVIEIGDDTQSANDECGVGVPREIHEKAFKHAHLDTVVRNRFANEALTLLDGEERRLGYVLEHAHHQPVNEAQAATDEIDVTVGQWIKTPRINRGTYRGS